MQTEPTINIILGNHITNIGNAFLDSGSEAMIRAAVPGARIIKTSSFPAWYRHTQMTTGLRRQRSSSGFFSIVYRIPSDYAVFSGMVISNGFVDRYGEIIRKLREQGTKIILNGAGPAAYTQQETDKCLGFWKEVGLHVLVSRDRYTLDTYGAAAEHSYDGIDCAYFLKYSEDPVEFSGEEFQVRNFDSSREPDDIPGHPMIVRTHHKIFPGTDLRNGSNLRTENSFLSEHAADYLKIYANAGAVYSDRVHACVASIAFNTPCRLYSGTSRGQLFERIGLPLERLRSELVVVDQEALEKERQAQVQFLGGVLSRAPVK